MTAKTFKIKYFNFSNFLQALRESTVKISIFIVINSIAAIAYCFIATPIYTASIIINPPKLSDKGNGLAANSLGGGAALLMPSLAKNDSEISASVLRTRYVLDMVIDKFNLQSYYKAKVRDDARQKLMNNTQIVQDFKTGFVTINVSDKSANLATQIANYYPVAMGDLISSSNNPGVKLKATFFYSQMQATSKNIESSQAALNNFAKIHGITAGVQPQILTGITTQMQTQLNVLLSQQKSLLNYATKDNPDYKKLQAQIDALKIQIRNISGTDNTAESIVIPANLAPELGQEYVFLVQNLTAYQELYRALQRQYEINKIDEFSNHTPSFVQIIDPADIPYYRTSPKRTKTVLITAFLSILIGVLFVTVKNHNFIFEDK